MLLHRLTWRGRRKPRQLNRLMLPSNALRLPRRSSGEALGGGAEELCCSIVAYQKEVFSNGAGTGQEEESIGQGLNHKTDPKSRKAQGDVPEYEACGVA